MGSWRGRRLRRVDKPDGTAALLGPGKHRSLGEGRERSASMTADLVDGRAYSGSICNCGGNSDDTNKQSDEHGDESGLTGVDGWQAK
jgi:hypothetical protein